MLQSTMEPESEQSASPEPPANPQPDYHDLFKEADLLLYQMDGISEDAMPSYLEPYKRGLQSLANSRDSDGLFLFDKAQKNSLLKRLTKKEFKKLSAEFEKLPNGIANMVEFVKLYMGNVAVPREDALIKLGYVTGLMDVFREIVARKKKPFVTWPEVSTAIMSNYVEESHGSEFGIANKYVYKSDVLRRAVSPRVLASVLWSR